MATPAVGMPAAVGAEAPRRRAPMHTAGLSGRVIGERYAVTGVIGEGGMGFVYEAKHLSIGKLVAIKVLHPRHAKDPEAVSRLRHEARVAGTLGHPNICAIYDMGRLDDGSPYLVLERLHGETLAQRLARAGRMEVADLLDIMLQVLSALAAAHQKGVIHRDLKPDNIFLSKREGMRPIPKLLDFGISRADDIEDTVDRSGNLDVGTPYYMAPEQARGDRHFDARVDLWSAGVVLYEALTGHRPFTAKNYNALLFEILRMPPRPLREHDPSLAPGLQKIIDRALAKDPADRYLSAIELQGALRSYKDLDNEAQRRVIPVLVNEATNDDSDGTHVFSRLDVSALARGTQAPPNLAAQSAADDAETPIYHGGDPQTPGPAGYTGSSAPAPRPDPIEEESTVVDPPLHFHDGPQTVDESIPPGNGKR
jgi:eukaryotic-like serine/threonine-protein kinase